MEVKKYEFKVFINKKWWLILKQNKNKKKVQKYLIKCKKNISLLQKICVCFGENCTSDIKIIILAKWH